MTPRILFCLLFTGAALCASAQSTLSLKYPGGLQLRPNCGMSRSMGGTGVGMLNDHHVMMSNPANLGSIDKTVFSSLLSMDFLNQHQDDLVANYLSVIPQQVAVAFSLGNLGSLGLSFDSRTDQRLKFRSTNPLAGINPATPTSLELAYSANGGITAWQAGWGYSIFKRAYVGVAYERAYYTLDQSRMQATNGVSGTSRSNDSTYVEWRGNAVRLGASVPIKDVVLGMTGEYFLKSEATQSSGVYWGTTVADSAEQKFDLQFPPSLGLGMSYKPRPEWLVALDVSTVLWGSFVGGGVLPAPEALRTYGAALGAQFIPAPLLLSPRYWETIRYRAGVRYNELPANSNQEIAFSLGAGFPLQASGLVDLALEYGWRTDQRYAGYGEEFLRIGIGVNAGRKWAKSTKESY